jgi:L-serine/L-threonine ammonia-lyase
MSLETVRLHVTTPVIESSPLSQLTSKTVYLKLDNAQQTGTKKLPRLTKGSFKIRGIGHNCTCAVKQRGATQIFSSSGGNAGIAVSYAARKLGVPCTVVVPTTTPDVAIRKMEEEGSKGRPTCHLS